MLIMTLALINIYLLLLLKWGLTESLLTEVRAVRNLSEESPAGQV